MNTKKILIYIITLYMFLYNISTTIYALPASSEETTTEITTTDVLGETPNSNIISPEGTILDIAAESCILIDADTGVILYEKNAHKKLYPASITKVMTSLLACEYGKFDETITHSHNAVFGIGQGSSHIAMDEGEEVNFRDGLYGVLLESANEVSMAVAEHIDGDVDTFVKRMNNRAKELGAEDTHFSNPHGFHDDNHYTTAYDMSLFVKAAVANPDFLEIFSTTSHTIPPTNKKEERPLHNKDRMLRSTSPYYYEYAIGGKTGYTSEAGNTLVTYASKDNINLITVVMNDPGAAFTYSDSKSLFEYGFSIYEEKEVFPVGEYVAQTPVTQKYNDKTFDLGTISISNNQALSALVPKFITSEDVTFNAKTIDNIPVPVSIGDKVGTVDIYYNDSVIGTIDIEATSNLEAIPEKTLQRQEKIQEIKIVVIKALKITGMVIAGVVIVVLILKLFFMLMNKMKRRKTGYINFNRSTRKQKYRKNKKKKYKFKIK